VSSREYSELID